MCVCIQYKIIIYIQFLKLKYIRERDFCNLFTKIFRKIINFFLTFF